MNYHFAYPRGGAPFRRGMAGLLPRPQIIWGTAITTPLALTSFLFVPQSKPGVKMNVETRAHLSESVSRIDEALKANMQRMGF